MDASSVAEDRAVWIWPGLLLLILALVGSGPNAGAATDPEPRSPTSDLRALTDFEARQRQATDWPARKRANFGPDPFRILRAPIEKHWIGILRGAGAVVLLDDQAQTRARAAAPIKPTGTAQASNGEILVVGEGSPEILRFRVSTNALQALPALRVPGVSALRDIAVRGPEWVVLDPVGHQVLAVDPRTARPDVRRLASCRGPTDLLSIDGLLLVNCLLDHRALLLDGQGRLVRSIEHHGPFWSLAAKRSGSDLLVAAGGVEDRPLDRSDGSFGYIDSFAFVYRIALPSGAISARTAVNLSSLGIVTPKWLEWLDADTPRLRLAGYASPGLLELSWKTSDLSDAPRVHRAALPPGTTDAADHIAANPLLDAWVRLDGEPPVGALPSPTPRSLESRVGEALFFTTLMAPWNESSGRRSRFTCETCHHEGYVDGRTHYTGRGEVHATTKPLVGLHGNRPYFSRALDPTMARMVHNEFRVANKGNGRDPWFPLPRDHFWTLTPAESQGAFSPLFLRRALMTFLMQFEHEPNPTTLGRNGFDALEREGAKTFLQHCEPCHAARLISDDPSSRLDFAAWEQNIFAAGTILWGRAGYEKTGVTPYVHADGARVPSLRRLHKKRPFFTNGEAADLESLLEGFAVGAPGLEHQGGATRGEPLSLRQRETLVSFLGLL